MIRTLQLIVAGILPLTANGWLRLLKEPPFPVLTPGWAAIASFDLENDVRPHMRRVFDFMAAHPRETTPLIVGAYNTWITGEMHCTRRDPIHRGVRYTIAAARYDWSTPCRLGDLRKGIAA